MIEKDKYLTALTASGPLRTADWHTLREGSVNLVCVTPGSAPLPFTGRLVHDRATNAGVVAFGVALLRNTSVATPRSAAPARCPEGKPKALEAKIAPRNTVHDALKTSCRATRTFTCISASLAWGVHGETFARMSLVGVINSVRASSA